MSNFWSHEIDTSDPSGQCSARGVVESTDSHCNALVVIKVTEGQLISECIYEVIVSPNDKPKIVRISAL